MQKITIEQALKNQLASAEMEGYHFKNEEIENARRCLENNMTAEDFLNLIVDKLKRT